MTSGNLYKVLGLQPRASLDEVKRAYRMLAREYHPDSRSGKASESLFLKITEAYNVLSNEKTKNEYDESIELFSDIHEKISAYRDSEKLKFGKDPALNKGSGAFQRPGEGSHYEGPPGLRFGGRSVDPVASARTKRSLFGKVSAQLEKLKAGSEEILGKVSTSFKRPQEHKGASGILRDEREFRFTIDALESIHGASREVAFDDEGTPRLIRVRIPGGVLPGSLLKVNYPPKSGNGPTKQLQVRVFVEPHDLVERDGYDITLKVPITVKEAVVGGEIEVPTLEGPMRIRIPPGWDLAKRLRVKDKGLPLPDSTERGNLFIRTYVALPPPSERLSEAATTIDVLYRDSVRKDIPRTLASEK